MTQTTNQTRSTVVLVEDDEDIRRLITIWLEQSGHEVHEAADGEEGLRVCYAVKPDLVLLDLYMPSMDGWELLRRIREMSTVPIIMLTNESGEQQKVRAFREGADDYVMKTVGRDELMARIEAATRRSVEVTPLAAEYEDSILRVDYLHHRVLVQGREVNLTPTEFRMLDCLVKTPGAVLSADQLLQAAWEDGTGGPANVRVYIGFLRKKLDTGGSTPPLIETVRSFGYRYHAPN